MPTYLDLIKKKDEEFEKLTKRMDADKRLQYLSAYEMQDANGKRVPNMIHITLPDTAIFSANILSSLGSATERIVVESEDEKLDKAYIEDFQKAYFESANDRLRRLGLPPLNIFIDEQTCIRGRTAVRSIPRMGVDGFIPDLTPWDSRYVRYGFSESGLAWASYETKRTKDMIMSEYGIPIRGQDATVIDVWDTKHNEVWIDQKQVVNQPHPFGFTPVAIQVVSLGSMLADEDSLEHSGESIFFLIRDVVPELNRLVSIAQTMNMRAVKNAYLWKTSQGIGAEPPDYEDLTGMGAVTSTEEHGGVEPLQIQDIQRAFIELNRIIEGRLQRGSLSNIDLGVLGTQPPSGVALLEVKAARDRVFIPRSNAKSLLNETLAEMFTKQVIQIGGSFELGLPGHKRTFQSSKLKGEYQTTYKYFVKSPELDAGALTLYAAAGDAMSDKLKVSEYLQLEDPEGDAEQKRWEEAERLSPAIKINRTIKALLEMADKGVEDAEFEAELLSTEMGVNLQQMLAGDVTQVPKPEKEQEAKQVIPLLGQGQRTPRREE